MRPLLLQRGLAMAEVIVSMGIGMLVLLAASALLVAASSNYRNNTESMRLHDGGRYALEVVAQAVRQASYVNWDEEQAPAGLAADAEASVAGLDARSLSRGSDGITAPLSGAVNGSDVLALRFSGSGAGGNGDGSVINCGGFAVPGQQSAAARGWSIFYVAEDAGGEAELRCKYRGANGWGADAVVRGVDSFQVLYGLDTDTPPDGTPNTYINASGVDALDQAMLLAGTAPAQRARELRRLSHWKRVCSVKLALLLHGETGSRAESAPMRFDLFGRAYAGLAGADTGAQIEEQKLPEVLRMRARRIFSTTIFLRNRSA
ncbi:PilW family protein [Oxalobacteraceae bacterium]|nr:PilW family protein [Oxalobacteraceae bacterium]